MLDIIYLSYDEKFADANYEHLKEIAPWAKRIHGVKGIAEAHYAAAKIANTRAFYVVDADAWITNFDFMYEPPADELTAIHVWRASNPVNGLVYGYGGLKLFPRLNILNLDLDNIVDFTTSIGTNFKIMPECVSETRFNTGPFESWKSAFRECTKLSSKVIHGQKNDETEERLAIWQTVGANQKFGQECVNGAIAGTKYGTDNKGDPVALKKINDFDWLRKQWKK